MKGRTLARGRVAAEPASGGAGMTEGEVRRALRVATAAYVLGWSAHTTFVFFLAPVALRAAGAGGYDAWVFSGTAIATMLVVLPAGWLADKHPRRRILRVSLGLFALSYVPLLGPPTLGGVLLATAFTGTGLAFLFVSFTSYVADLLSQKEASNAYGTSSALAILAGALGPFLASLVFRVAPTEVMALHANALLFAVGALAGVLLTLTLPHARLPPTAASAAAPPAASTDFRAALPVVLLYLLMGAGYGMMLPYFAVYFLDHVRLAPATWGLLLAAATLMGALGSVLAGRLGNRWPLGTIVGSQVFHVLGAAAFLLPLGGLALGLVYVARNVAATAVAPVASAITMARARPAARARSQGYASLAWNVGWAIGAAAGGVLLLRLGGALFPLAALLGLAGALVLAVLMRGGAAESTPSLRTG